MAPASGALGRGLLGALGRGLLGALGGGLLGALGGAFLGAFGGGSAFLALFLFLFDHLHLARGCNGLCRLGRFLFFGARRGDGDDGHLFVADQFDSRGGFDLPQVDDLAQFEMGNVHGNELRQVLGQAASADPEEDVFQNAAAGLDTFGFAEGLDGDADGHLFVFGDLVEVHVQDLAGEGMVLDFLHQRQALGPGVILDLQVHQEVLGDRAVDEVFHFLDLDFEILGLGLAAVNDRRHASLGTEFLGPGAPAHHPGRMR